MTKIQYVKQNWKLGIHLIFRTKRFGVNNRWWNDFDSMFGLSLYEIIFSVLKIRPLIDNYKLMKFRAENCHFLSDGSFELLFGHKKGERNDSR